MPDLGANLGQSYTYCIYIVTYQLPSGMITMVTYLWIPLVPLKVG